MHDFVSYLFYLLQRGMRFAVPAALICGLILAVCYAVCRKKGRPEVYSLGPHVNSSTPNTLQVLSELLPELKSNTVTPPSDDGIDTLPATEDVSATESVN